MQKKEPGPRGLDLGFVPSEEAVFPPSVNLGGIDTLVPSPGGLTVAVTGASVTLDYVDAGTNPDDGTEAVLWPNGQETIEPVDEADSLPVLKEFLMGHLGLDDESELPYIKDIPTITLLTLYKDNEAVRSVEESLKTRVPITRSPDDILGTYMAEIGQYPRLERDQLNDLFATLSKAVTVLTSLETLDGISPHDQELLAAGAVAYRTIYLCNLKLVIKAVKQTGRPRSIPAIDLIQEGNFGLDAAIARFSVEKGFRFSTYAMFWIRQAITIARARQSRVVRVPRKANDDYWNMRDTMSELQMELGRTPNDVEVVERTGMELKRVRELRIFGPVVQPSLNAPLTNADERPFHNTGSYREVGTTLADADADMEVVAESLFRLGVVSSIFELEVHGEAERERLQQEQIVFSLRYNLYIEALSSVVITRRDGTSVAYRDVFTDSPAPDGRTLVEVGAILGYSKEWVRLIENRGVDRIHQHGLSLD